MTTEPALVTAALEREALKAKAAFARDLAEQWDPRLHRTAHGANLAAERSRAYGKRRVVRAQRRKGAA